MPLQPEVPRSAEIGLGTVQFGLDYGISNPGGRTPPKEVERILSHAYAHGIRVLDTAPAYGESERVLGLFPLGEKGFRVITKTPVFNPAGGESPARQLGRCLEASLLRLGIPKVYGLLFHRAADLAGEQGKLLMDEARRCRARGQVEKIGVSVYTAAEIDAVMDAGGIDLIQLPVNVFDQRLLFSGHLRSLRTSGVEIHVRSVFLQGLLLMKPEELPPGLESARSSLEAFRSYAAGKSLTPLQAALGFVLGLPEADIALCGVNTAEQLDDICAGASPLQSEAFRSFAIKDAAVLNPSLWGART